jgi:hypothetical protein
MSLPICASCFKTELFTKRVLRKLMKIISASQRGLVGGCRFLSAQEKLTHANSLPVRLHE